MSPPRFSVIVIVTEAAEVARAQTESVTAQTFEGWELLLVGAADSLTWAADLPSDDDRVRLERVASAGPRESLTSKLLQRGLAAAAGEFLVLVDGDCFLDPATLAAFDASLVGDIVIAYGDHEAPSDQPTGPASWVHHHPDWSPERLRHGDYVGDVVALHRVDVEAVGGFLTESAGAERLDLLLRLAERRVKVVHVSDVVSRRSPASALVDARTPPPDAGTDTSTNAACRAVGRHLERMGIAARVSPGTLRGRLLIDRSPDYKTAVSVIIPTMGSRGMAHGESRIMVVEAVRSLASTSEHAHVEFVVVYDAHTPPDVLVALRQLRGIDLKLVEFTLPFNFSRKCNVGALAASGDILVFANDDLQAISRGVLERLIMPLHEDGVGLTGPKLLFETGQIQHAGLVYGSGTIAHSYYRLPDEGATGVDGELLINREVSALTGACVATWRSIFEDVGGFSEAMPVNYNDVDFSLKIRAQGLRLLWLHDVVLFHFESVSRSNVVHDWEKDLITRRWGDYETVVERYSSRLSPARVTRS